MRAWWVAAARDGVRGPLAELGGERVYVLRTRLDAAEGGTRVECGDGPIWVLETAPGPVALGVAALRAIRANRPDRVTTRRASARTVSEPGRGGQSSEC